MVEGLRVFNVHNAAASYSLSITIHVFVQDYVFFTGSEINCILWFPQNPAIAAAFSVASFAALDHMAGTVKTKSIGVDRTMLGDSCFSKTLIKCVWRHER